MQQNPYAKNLTVRLRPETYELLKLVAKREERKYAQVLDRAIRLYTTGQRDLPEAALK